MTAPRHALPFPSLRKLHDDRIVNVATTFATRNYQGISLSHSDNRLSKGGALRNGRPHVLQHVPFEGLGSIETWLHRREAEVSCTRFFQNPTLPELDNLDLVIVMGGPMSVDDEADFPWLNAEKHFLREAIRLKKVVLRICLGAQLIAHALVKRSIRI